MARKLLSFLGTGRYQMTSYSLDGCRSAEQPFIQAALVDFLKIDPGSGDEVVLFVTAKAKAANYDGENGLGAVIRKKIGDAGCRCVPIPDGKSDAELWEIFGLVLDNISPGDEVYFDITHAFRSLPAMSLIIGVYARVVKKALLKDVLYGAFEASSDGMTPVFRLTPFIDLFDWTLAVDQYVTAGRSDRIEALVHGHVAPIQRAARGEDQEAKVLGRLAARLREFTDALATCRGAALTGKASNLNKALDAVSNTGRLPAFDPLLGRIRDAQKGFSGDVVSNMLEAARMCFHCGQYQQSVTLLQEMFITKGCLDHGLSEGKREDREAVGMCLGMKARNIPPEQGNDNFCRNFDRNKAIMERLSSTEALLYHQLSIVRNDINHAGFCQPLEAREFARKIGDFIRQAETVVRGRRVAGGDPLHH